ncbi:MAG: LCP family protein [Candidatus Kerfeldbacteria bacterium]|nr:LCP family protein [Candidatus Kerfeldbacteria bacterium]
MPTPPPLTTLPSFTTPRNPRRGKFWLYFLLLIILSWVIWLSRQPQVQATIIEWPSHSLWENVKRLVSGGDKLLQGEADGRINFLLLGQGGLGHDGPFLTDTIVMASLKPATNQVALLSIPRDLVVPIPGAGARRINNANAIGEERASGSGPALASQVVSDVLGLPIHYYVRLDFDGFAKMVDDLGGVPINIKEGFTDTKYPTDSDGYTSVSFKPGFQVLSGARALEFVRSRHGSNGQGSDFARGRRQQQLLMALKDKLLSPATFLNPKSVLRLYRTFTQSIKTNLTAQDAVHLAGLLRHIKPSDVVTRSFDTTPRGLLHEIIGADGAYLLVANVSDYSQLKQAAESVLEVSPIEAEAARLIIENGTATVGLAEAVNESLSQQGFTVTSFGNAPHNNFRRTIIYDYSNGRQPNTRAMLETLFRTTAVSLERTAANTEPDFRIIVGSDYQITNP